MTRTKKLKFFMKGLCAAKKFIETLPELSNSIDFSVIYNFSDLFGTLRILILDIFRLNQNRSSAISIQISQLFQFLAINYTDYIENSGPNNILNTIGYIIVNSKAEYKNEPKRFASILFYIKMLILSMKNSLPENHQSLNSSFDGILKDIESEEFDDPDIYPLYSYSAIYEHPFSYGIRLSRDEVIHNSYCHPSFSEAECRTNDQISPDDDSFQIMPFENLRFRFYNEKIIPC